MVMETFEIICAGLGKRCCPAQVQRFSAWFRTQAQHSGQRCEYPMMKEIAIQSRCVFFNDWLNKKQIRMAAYDTPMHRLLPHPPFYPLNAVKNRQAAQRNLRS